MSLQTIHASRIGRLGSSFGVNKSAPVDLTPPEMVNRGIISPEITTALRDVLGLGPSEFCRDLDTAILVNAMKAKDFGDKWLLCKKSGGSSENCNDYLRKFLVFDDVVGQLEQLQSQLCPAPAHGRLAVGT